MSSLEDDYDTGHPINKDPNPTFQKVFYKISCFGSLRVRPSLYTPSRRRSGKFFLTIHTPKLALIDLSRLVHMCLARVGVVSGKTPGRLEKPSETVMCSTEDCKFHF